MGDEKTPGEQMNEAIGVLEDNAQGALAGLSDKVSSSFWDRIKTFFYTMAASVWLALPDFIRDFWPEIAADWKEQTLDTRSLNINEVIDSLLENIDDPRSMIDKLEELNMNYPGMGWLLSVLNVMIVFGGIVRAHSETIFMKANQTMLSEKRPSLIPIDALLEALYKAPDTEYEVKDVMDRLGISDDLQDILKIAAKRVLEPDAIRQAYLRDEIDEEQLYSKLKAHRLDDDDIGVLKKLYDIIPPVQDIIVMAVREVFSPEIVARFGQMQDFPADFAVWAKKQGLSEQWAKNYWAAHWSLPSPLQGFRMLHRGVIDSEELDVLLRALDIMPYWRDKLTEIAYNPLTRVDVRRMFDLGVIDESGVTRAYKDLGYNEYNANLMTKFTIRYVSEHERNLTRSDIISLFKKGALSEDEAIQRLVAMGYSLDNAYLLLYRAVYEMESKLMEKAVSSVRKLYVAGKIKENEAHAILAKHNLEANEINRYFEIWDLDRLDKVRNLTAKDIERFYKARIISKDETFNELRELGYNREDADRFVAVFTQKE